MSVLVFQDPTIHPDDDGLEIFEKNKVAVQRFSVSTVIEMAEKIDSEVELTERNIFFISESLLTESSIFYRLIDPKIACSVCSLDDKIIVVFVMKKGKMRETISSCFPSYT